MILDSFDISFVEFNLTNLKNYFSGIQFLNIVNPQ